jgi:hypothetical protein
MITITDRQALYNPKDTNLSSVQSTRSLEAIRPTKRYRRPGVDAAETIIKH